MNEVELSRLTRLLPLAVLAAAICLFASELMTTFEFTPQGGEVQLEQVAADRHGNALIVIAVFAIVALAVAVLSGSKPAATAVAIAGVVALLVFLLIDLPDANATGTLDTDQSFIDAQAIPREGFYLELVGALALAVTGIALATLTPEQLASLRPARRPRPTEARGESLPPTSSSSQGDSRAAAPANEDKGRLSRLARRPRARQRG